jgi:hypothetical protein
MQKIFGGADPATSRRTQAGHRMKGRGRGRTPRSTRGRVPPGRTKPTQGWGFRRRKPPQTGLKRLVSSVTGRH